MASGWFDLHGSAIAPALEGINSIYMEDLLLVVNFFRIKIPKGGLKRDIKEARLMEMLRE